MLYPSLSDVLDVALTSALADVHTSMPGVVVSYDAASRRASVQPLIQRAYFDEDDVRQVERYPVLPSVPVVMPGNSSVGLVWTVKPGDRVLIVFSESSMNQWLAQDSEGDPLDERRHSLSDALAIPGLNPTGDVTDDVGDALVLHGDDVKLGSKDASKRVALNDEVRDGIIGCLSDESVIETIALFPETVAINTPIVGAVEARAGAAALVGIAVNSYFALNPMPGATKVKAE